NRVAVHRVPRVVDLAVLGIGPIATVRERVRAGDAIRMAVDLNSWLLDRCGRRIEAASPGDVNLRIGNVNARLVAENVDRVERRGLAIEADGELELRCALALPRAVIRKQRVRVAVRYEAADHRLGRNLRRLIAAAERPLERQ